ncbi:hypothetical protein [Actinomadura gamaensis]|uniref:HEAT repeat domain-containing protein n=1 Tax=Actinomadura gamaensis TaxID=1763541 RepID=A0ABV9U754_9ACTN
MLKRDEPARLVQKFAEAAGWRFLGLIEILKRASRDDLPIVRYATLFAIADAEWPECLSLARDLTKAPDPEVAQLAGQVLEAFEEYRTTGEPQHNQ